MYIHYAIYRLARFYRVLNIGKKIFVWYSMLDCKKKEEIIFIVNDWSILFLKFLYLFTIIIVEKEFYFRR